MQNLEALVKNLKAMGLPLDAIDTIFFTEDEKEFFYRFCRKHGLKHSDEINIAAASVGVADPIHY